MEIAEEGILKGANVLIVSDRESYRVDAVNYGFANVDYFASEICAYEYFRKNIRRFRAYDIIIIGDLVTRGIDGFKSGFAKMVEDLKRRNPRLLTVMVNSYEKDGALLCNATYARKYRGGGFTDCEFTRVLETIVEIAALYGLQEGTTKRKQFLKCIERPYVQDKYVSPSDVKILFCYPTDLPFDVKKALGIYSNLNIEVSGAPANFVVPRLGDYDIIIGSEEQMPWLSHAAIESREQCKRNGRPISLLATYRSEIYHNELDKGTDTKLERIELSVNYVRGGSNWIKQEDVVSLRLPFVYKEWNSLEYIYNEQSVQIFKALILNAVCQYRKILGSVDSELFFEGSAYGHYTQEHYDTLYTQEYEQAKRKIDKEYKPISHIIDIENYVSKYCEYRNRGLAFANSNRVRISESETGYRIEDTYKGQLALCSLTLSKKNMGQPYKIVSLKSISKGKKLGEEKTVFVGPIGLIDRVKNRPMLANDGDIAVINQIHNAVMEVIKPIVDSIDTPDKDFTGEEKRFVNRPQKEQNQGNF